MGRKLFSILLVIFSTNFTRADNQNLECFECKSNDTDRSCIDKPGDKFCKPVTGDCFLNKTETGVTRGCINDYKDLEPCDQNSECERCHGDKCNGAPITTTPSLKCFMCDGCAENPDDVSSPESCAKLIPYKKTEMCFTYTMKEDEKLKTKKGCFYDLSEEEQSECLKQEDSCKTCKDEGCNKDTHSGQPTEATTKATTKATPEAPDTTEAPEPPKPTDPPNSEDFKCIICRSDVNSQNACASKEIKGEDFTKFSQKCEATPKNSTEKACYIQRLENGVVIRDCFSTALALNLDISEGACDIKKNPKTKCNYCDRTECNIGEPRNSGNQVGTYGTFVALAAVLVTRSF